MIVRTPENDYGVLSDPDENSTQQTTELELKDNSRLADENLLQADLEIQPVMVMENAHPQPLENPPPHLSIPVYSHSQNEQPQPSHLPLQSSPSLSPSPQDPDPSLQDLILQSQSSKSLETLKLKLSRDKNFSRKMTLHTFFSYIILAMEIQRSCSASIAQISVISVQELVTYMIENHSASNPVRIYLHTLNDTGVVKNIIESIIDFNKDNKNSSLESLYTSEQSELEISLILNSVIERMSTNTGEVNVTASQSNEQPENKSSQKCGGLFKRLRCFFSGCCG